MNIQNWLKNQRMRAYNFGARGNNLTKRYHVTCREGSELIEEDRERLGES